MGKEEGKKRKGGGLMLTGKFCLDAFAHEAVFYVVKCPEDIGRHDGFLAPEGSRLVGPVCSFVPRQLLLRP